MGIRTLRNFESSSSSNDFSQKTSFLRSTLKFKSYGVEAILLASTTCTTCCRLHRHVSSLGLIRRFCNLGDVTTKTNLMMYRLQAEPTAYLTHTQRLVLYPLFWFAVGQFEILISLTAERNAISINCKSICAIFTPVSRRVTWGWRRAQPCLPIVAPHRWF